MTRDTLYKIDAPDHGRLFCEHGAKSARNAIPSVDPIVYDREANAYDPSTGFDTFFGMRHSELGDKTSAEGLPMGHYNNYATASDFNLIFYLASLGTILPSIGYPFGWSATFSKSIKGYPWGAIVSDGNGRRFISVKNDNTDPLEEGSLSWIRYTNSCWFNYTNHVQVHENDIDHNHSVSKKSEITFIKMKGGGLKSEDVGNRPVVVYRLHSVQLTEPPYDVTSWFQAYKYWIGYEGQTLCLFTKIDGSIKKCTTASIEQFNAETGKNVQPGPVKNIRQFYGRPGAYVIHWGPSGNPFRKTYPETAPYSIYGVVSDDELALDAATYGYGTDDMFVVPEFDDESETLTYTLTTSDLSNLHGLMSIGGEAALLLGEEGSEPTEDNLDMLSFVGTISRTISEMKMGDGWPSSIAGSSNTDSLSDELPGSILQNLPISFDNPSATKPEDNGAKHYRLSSDPTFIRRGVQIDLVIRCKVSQQETKDIPVATLYRNMWTEFANKVVQHKADMSGVAFATYGKTIIPDFVDREYSAWQKLGPTMLSAMIPNVIDSPGVYSLVIVARFKNIQIPRRFITSPNSRSYRSPDDFYSEQFGMYYPGYMDGEFRTYFSARSVPFERVQNALTRKSFNVPPREW